MSTEAKSKQRVRVVMCIADGATRLAASETLGQTGQFEIVGIAADLDELVNICQVQYPDVLVVDEDVTGPDVEAALVDARAGRPVPAVVFGRPAPPKRPKRRPNMRAQATRMIQLDKAQLHAGFGGQAQLQTRLLMLAAEVTTAKHTQTARSLQEAIKMVRARVRHSGMRPEVVAISAVPRDLIALIGGTGSDSVLDRLLPKVTTARVPVVAAIRNLDDRVRLSLDAATKAPVHWLDESVRLRRATGVSFITTDAAISPEWIEIRAQQPTNLAELVPTMACLGTAGLTIAMADDQTDWVQGLGAITNAGGHVAVVDPAACPSPQAVTQALEWGVAEMTLTLEEIGFVINQAVPRKV